MKSSSRSCQWPFPSSVSCTMRIRGRRVMQSLRLLLRWGIVGAVLLGSPLGCSEQKAESPVALPPSPSPLPVLTQARSLLAQSKPDEALHAFESALELHPEDLHLHREYQDLMRTSGRIRDAQQRYAARAKAEPRSAMAQYLYGRSLILESPVEAEGVFKLAIELDPGFIWPYLGQGTASMVRGDVFAAVQVYEKALLRFPRSADLYINLAEARGQIGALRNAIEAAEQATRLSPTDSRAFEVLGVLQHKLGDVDAAQRSLEQALRLNPRLGVAHQTLAALLQKRGKLEDARRHATEAEKLGRELSPELKQALEASTP